MLLIIEIALTIAAWKKGWKGWALLPGAVAFLMGFMVGAVMGAANIPMENMAVPFLLLEVVCVLVPLIVLAVRAPKKGTGTADLPGHVTAVRG